MFIPFKQTLKSYPIKRISKVLLEFWNTCQHTCETFDGISKEFKRISNVFNRISKIFWKFDKTIKRLSMFSELLGHVENNLEFLSKEVVNCLAIDLPESSGYRLRYRIRQASTYPELTRRFSCPFLDHDWLLWLIQILESSFETKAKGHQVKVRHSKFWSYLKSVESVINFERKLD